MGKSAINIGYVFKNPSLLQQALTHPSKKLENPRIISYQRLEFLGDKVLNFIIAQELFLTFPNESEGDISRRHAHLVCGPVCYEVAKKLDIFPHIIYSKAQKQSEASSQMKIGEDVIEAIIGAIFLDSDITKAKNFVKTHWQEYIVNDKTPPKDFKSALQEYIQKTVKSLPAYKTRSTPQGFVSQITVNGQEFSASASTKKEAEKLAAKKALDSLQ